MSDYIQKLEAKLMNVTEVREKVDSMNDLAWELRHIDMERAWILSEEAFKIAENLSYENGIARSRLCKGVYFSLAEKIEEAIEQLVIAIGKFEKLEDSDGLIKAYNTFGYICNMTGKKSEAIEHFLKALTPAKESKHPLYGYILNNISEIYGEMGKYEEALTNLQQVIDYEESDNHVIAYAIINMTKWYLALGNTEMARQYGERGLKLVQQNRELKAQGLCLMILGRVYKEIDEIKKSIDYYQRALEAFKEIDNKYHQTEVLIDISRIYLDITEQEKGLETLEDALKIAEEVSAKTLLYKIHSILAEVYEEKQDFQKALDHYKKHTILNEEVASRELDQKLNNLTIKARTEQIQKNAEIHRLKNIELKESYKNISVISEIGQKITSTLETEKILNTIYESINSLMNVTSFGIGLYDEKEGSIEFKMFIENHERLPEFKTSIEDRTSFAAWCIRNRKEVIIQDIEKEYSKYVERANFIPGSLDAMESLSIIYNPLIIENKIIGMVTVQSTKRNAYTKHNIDTVKALSSYIAIAMNNSHKSEELKITAEKLANTLEHLQGAQTQLIQSEKMAALGQLIAGVAHEINTPLGAIKASASNISDYLQQTYERLPLIYDTLAKEQKEIFFELVKRAIDREIVTSTKEERKLKKKLRSELEEQDIENIEDVTDLLADMGIYEDVGELLPLLKSPEKLLILQVAYHLTGLKRNTDNIEMAMEKAAKIVFALKSFAYVDHSGEMLEIDVTKGIETVLTIYHNQIKQGTEIIRRYREVPAVKCHPDELNQVWTNIIHNALQAMEYKGTIEIGIGQEENWVVIGITDSGKGIPEEIKDRIFEPFFTTKAQGEGTGLGLDIVKKIVDKHQGKLSVESQPGKTTFTVKLPIKNEFKKAI